YYYMEDSSVNMEDAIVNIAYFGNFYSRRSYKIFLNFVQKLNENYNLLFKLHIFTNKNQLDVESLEELESENIAIHDYLPFTKFLNALTKFDALLISDAETKQDKPINPYLPSKLSDYLGSGSLILAMTEQFSVMSNINDESLFSIDLDVLKTLMRDNEFAKNSTINEFVKELSRRKSVVGKRYLEHDELMILKEN